MEALIVGLLLLVLSAQGAVWYKLGRLESRLNGHLARHHHVLSKAEGEEGR
jgi:hypothetical protein